MVQCLKICEGLLPKNGRLAAISGQIILILMLDQFSQRRKMSLVLAHLKHLKLSFTNFSLEVTAL